MNYRHEWKHEISYADLLSLRLRLSAVMERDSHGVNGKYEIRSLYFDSPGDRALREKLGGVNCREKFRLRYYNRDISLIFLEKKSKFGNLCAKEQCVISRGEAQKLLGGGLDWMMDSGRPLCRELYCKMRTQGLGPKTVVDYTREPFVFPAGNVRVTLDYGLRTGAFPQDFLDPDSPTLPAGEAPIILEVKWDEFLPDIVRDAVAVPNRHAAAFSKYAQCRIYG